MDEQYGFYLCTREWAVKRRAVEKRARGICERCKYNKMQHVHHLTYVRRYRELLSDLLGVCQQCHDYIHAISDYDPKVEAERKALRRKARHHHFKKRMRKERKHESTRMWFKLLDNRLTEHQAITLLDDMIRARRRELGITGGVS